VNYAISPATFEIVDLDYLVLRAYVLDCVGHQEEVHGHDAFHLNLENTVNASYQAVWILFDVLEVVGQVTHDDVQLFLEHGLDDELAVMGKEEEAPRLPLALPSLEDSFIIPEGRQRLLYLRVIDPIHLSELFELGEGEVGDAHLHVDHLPTMELVCYPLMFLGAVPLIFLVLSIKLFNLIIYELAVLGNIPPRHVVDLDFIQLHRPNVLEGVHLAQERVLMVIVHRFSATPSGVSEVSELVFFKT